MKLAHILLAAGVTTSALFLSGCNTTETTQVDPKSTAVINSTQISPNEWSQAAEKLTRKLLTSGVIDRAPELPAILAISRVVNNTQMMIDTDMLTKKIRVVLNENGSGKVLTTTTLGLGGQVEDPLAKEAAEYNRVMTGQKQQTKMPHYTLSGKIIENRIRDGNKTQVTYTFQMSLTTVADGLAAWEAEEELSKVATKSALGVW